MIELDDACKSFKTPSGRKVVLDRATIRMPTGRSFGVLGANGQGKSTLVRVMAGVEHLDSGTVRRSRRVSFPLGFSGTFVGHLTGRENARFLAGAHGADEDEVLDYVERFAQLGEYLRMPVSKYSSGMVARLAFGTCLAIDFDVYLIDEITAVGDARFQARCLEAFADRMDRSDVVMVSHDLRSMREYCDAGAVLRDGVLTTYDDIEQAIAVHERNMREPQRETTP